MYIYVIQDRLLHIFVHAGSSLAPLSWLQPLSKFDSSVVFTCTHVIISVVMAYFKLKQLWQSYFIELKLELFEITQKVKLKSTSWCDVFKHYSGTQGSSWIVWRYEHADFNRALMKKTQSPLPRDLIMRCLIAGAPQLACIHVHLQVCRGQSGPHIINLYLCMYNTENGSILISHELFEAS